MCRHGGAVPGELRLRSCRRGGAWRVRRRSRRAPRLRRRPRRERVGAHRRGAPDVGEAVRRAGRGRGRGGARALGLELDGHQHARAAVLQGQADHLLGQGRQQLVRAVAPAVGLERQAHEREGGPVAPPADLAAAGELPVGDDDLLDDHRQPGGQGRAEGALQAPQGAPELALQDPAPGALGDAHLHRDGPAPDGEEAHQPCEERHRSAAEDAGATGAEGQEGAAPAGGQPRREGRGVAPAGRTSGHGCGSSLVLREWAEPGREARLRSLGRRYLGVGCPAPAGGAPGDGAARRPCAAGGARLSGGEARARLAAG